MHTDKYIKLETLYGSLPRSFESEFGFKSPGFTVDALGNTPATSPIPLVLAVAEPQTGDYSVTTTGGNFRITSNTVIVDAGDNPNNNTKKRYNLFLQILVPGSFNPFDGSNVLYNTGIPRRNDDDTISNRSGGTG